MKASDLSRHAMTECCLILCGAYIGSGVYREVFKNRMDPSTVVKVEQEGENFANILEWEVWQQARHAPALAKWFSPCRFISPSGAVMIQAMTTPCLKRDLPRRVPGFLTDMKQDNRGWLDGRVVCHDYGNILIGGGAALKKADWL